MAAVLAVVGFVLVVIGAPDPDSGESASNSDYGWFAYPSDGSYSETTTDPDGSFSSTLEVHFQDDSSLSTPLLIGVSMIGLSALLTAGVIGQWAIAGRKTSA